MNASIQQLVTLLLGLDPADYRAVCRELKKAKDRGEFPKLRKETINPGVGKDGHQRIPLPKAVGSTAPDRGGLVMQRKSRRGKPERYTREELSAMARTRCERQRQAGKDPDFAKELRELTSGHSAPTIFERMAATDVRLSDTRRGIAEMNRQLDRDRQYANKKFGETNEAFAKRTSTLARQLCAEAAAQGRSLSFESALSKARGI